MVKDNLQKRAVCIIATGILMFFSGFVFFDCPRAEAGSKVSGKLLKGFRILEGRELAGSPEFFVFRGDYIKFDIKTGSALLAIPQLGIEGRLVANLDQAPYFKMKKVGVFDIYINDLPATLTVMEYKGANYRAVSAGEAQDVIETFSPLILDVRTPQEYAQAHLADALLIPVQTLQKRVSELSSHKDEPILIYCATGNRSTVASKILIDRGFTRIFNLRHGIADWYRKKYPIVK